MTSVPWHGRISSCRARVVCAGVQNGCRPCVVIRRACVLALQSSSRLYSFGSCYTARVCIGAVAVSCLARFRVKVLILHSALREGLRWFMAEVSFVCSGIVRGRLSCSRTVSPFPHNRLLYSTGQSAKDGKRAVFCVRARMLAKTLRRFSEHRHGCILCACKKFCRFCCYRRGRVRLLHFARMQDFVGNRQSRSTLNTRISLRVSSRALCSICCL